MTHQQALAFGLVVATVAAFIWGRFRYDLIALAALIAGVAVGVVPPAKAFAGFSNDIVVIIGGALVVSAAFSRSGLVEIVLRPITPYLKTEATQVPAMAVATCLLSMASKNVGALAILMPVALQIARRTGSSPARLLMPMSFAAMLGGLVTMVGTSPNIIVSQVRRDLLGHPFRMFDYSPVGLGLAAMGLVFLAFGYRLLPKRRDPVLPMEAALEQRAYFTEARVPEGWVHEEMRVFDLHALAEKEVRVAALLRKGARRAHPHANTKIVAGDDLLLEGAPKALDRLIARAKLVLTRSDAPPPSTEAKDEVRVIEAVIGPQSSLHGRSAGEAGLSDVYGVNLLAFSRPGMRTRQNLSRVKLRSGDMIVLQGGERAMPTVLADLGLAPLAEREVGLGGARKLFTPALILAVAMTLAALQVTSVAVAFFAAAVALIVTGVIRLREAYAALDGPLLVLIAAMIPVSEAIQTTGGSDLIARALSGVFQHQSPMIALGALMAAAMAVTPFLNNAATVLIVAPIGAGLAQRLGLAPDPFLMAVAVGAGCDFLSPVGHQCNTLVMGPGGYRFSDYPRLGAPLTVLVLVAGVLLISLFWPLRAISAG